jgi:CRISPR-associated protein Csx10
MPVLRVEIEAGSPLVFSERRPAGQFRETLPFVPGTALRGALAQELIDSGMTTNDSDFKALFIDNAPFFRNAYLAVDDGDHGIPLPSRPLPATAYSCKAEPGFEGHGVHDSLIDRLCFEELGIDFPLYLPKCNKCEDGGRVEAFSGFHCGKKSISAPFQLTTRVAINRRRKVAEESMLYSPMVISDYDRNKPTMFHGSIVVAKENEDVVKKHLSGLTHIGSGVSRGFGRVKITVADAPPDDLKSRFGNFNKKVAARWGLWRRLSKGESAEPGHYFAVMLMSDVILKQDGWTPTVRLETSLLRDAGKGAVLVRCYAPADYRGGWNTAWGLPKDTDLVARMGSVYVYHVPPLDQYEDRIAVLRALEEHGVGERRAEGYGQVRVCDEFHLEIQEVKKS